MLSILLYILILINIFFRIQNTTNNNFIELIVETLVRSSANQNSNLKFQTDYLTIVTFSIHRVGGIDATYA